jgi:hypothetical protein
VAAVLGVPVDVVGAPDGDQVQLRAGALGQTGSRPDGCLRIRRTNRRSLAGSSSGRCPSLPPSSLIGALTSVAKA